MTTIKNRNKIKKMIIELEKISLSDSGLSQTNHVNILEIQRRLGFLLSIEESINIDKKIRLMEYFNRGENNE